MTSNGSHTRAACHFGKLPDGRYAAGMPNQELDFGKVNALFLYSAWRADYKSKDETIWPKEVQSYYSTLDRLLQESNSPKKFLLNVSKLVGWLRASDSFYAFTGASRPIYSEAATWLSGTPNQYYASSPLLPMTGKSYWMAAQPIWDMKNYPGDYESGAANPLSAFAPTKSAEDFVSLAYIFQTGTDDRAQPKFVDPLVLYLRVLTTPKNLVPEDPISVTKGSQIFQQRCVTCHDGPEGETKKPYPSQLMNTPSVLVDPLLRYVPPKKLSANIYNKTIQKLGYKPLTNGGIYSRKLKGIYARQHIMLNGSVENIEAAFCLKSNREYNPKIPDGLRADVHLDLCKQGTLEEKSNLISFLKDWD